MYGENVYGTLNDGTKTINASSSSQKTLIFVLFITFVNNYNYCMYKCCITIKLTFLKI